MTETDITMHIEDEMHETHTEGSGNTKHRAYFLTTFDLTLFERIRDSVLRYKSLTYGLCALDTCPTTGRQHYHWYLHFNTGIVWKSIKALSGSSNVQPARKSPNVVINYVMKSVTEDNPVKWEYGEKPHQGAVTVGHLREIPINDCQWNQYNIKRSIMRSDALIKDANDDNKNVRVIYLWGKSGAGKSLAAKWWLRKIGRTIYNCTKYNEIKYSNGFWLGVSEFDQPKMAWYDDFRDSHLSASEFINFIDYNEHNLNVKGGNAVNKYEFIVITSVQDPRLLYRNVDDEPRHQWIRRLEKYHIPDNFASNFDFTNIDQEFNTTSQ